MATLTGTNGADIADVGNPTVTGFSGATYTELTDATADLFDAGDGDDLIVSGSADDTLIGGLGNDTMRGGAGGDVFQYFSAAEIGTDIIDGGASGPPGPPDRLQINFTGLADFTTATIESTGVSSIEYLGLTGAGHLVLFNASQVSATGLATNLQINGDASGVDVVTFANASGVFDINAFRFTTWDSAVDRIIVTGTSGADDISGGSVADWISAGEGDDTLLGRADADTLDGGLGNDTMTGGSGSDVFLYGAGQQSDVITDFGARYYRASMTGGQEVPAVVTSGFGTGILNLNRSQTSLSMTVTLGALSSALTAMHIHNAAAGVSGPVVFDVGTGPIGGQTAGVVINTWTTGTGLDATQLGRLVAGTLYLNAHTSNNSGGEVRGQILTFGEFADKIDVTSRNIGEFETLQSFLASNGADAVLATHLDGQISTLTLTGLAGLMTADDFILQTATTADNFSGTANADDLFGAGGGDTLSGLAGDDRLYGESGDDTLIGGLGNDTMRGGAGSDVFQFAFADLQAGTVDRIVDYTPGTDAIRVLSNVGGDTVSTAAANAVVTFGNGYQIELTAKAGSVIRLDFTDRWEYWDTGTNAPWSRYTDYLNANGQISDQEIINDNGTLTQRHVDLSPGGSLHAWIEYTDYYSAAPNTLTDQEIRYDNGTIGQRHIAQAGTLEYTDYVTSGGVLLDQEVINLNGTREQRHYDPTNTRSAEWSSYIDYFNAANPAQIVAKSIVYDGTGYQDQWHYSTPGSTAHGYVDHFDNLGAFLGRDLF